MKKSHLFLVAFVLLAVFGAGYAYISNIPQGSASKNIDDLLQRAEHGDVEDLYELAVAYDKGRGVEQSDVKAFDYYKQAANNGLAKAQNTVGSFYELGRGVEKNIDLAVSWYRKAADQGYVLAQLNLGVIEYRNQKYETARSWFEAAAEEGDVEAQSFLGTIYAKGQGVDVDLEKSLFWHEKSAQNGSAESQYALGQHYYSIQKYEDAFAWYKKASDQGLIQAKHNLARMYENGQGVEKNLLRAGELYKAIDDHSSEVTKDYLKKLEDYCAELSVPSASDVEACLISAAASSLSSQRKLIDFYYKGEGVKKDVIEAFSWAFVYLSSYSTEELKQPENKAVIAASSLMLGELDDTGQQMAKKRSKEYLKRFGAAVISD